MTLSAKVNMCKFSNNYRKGFARNGGYHLVFNMSTCLLLATGNVASVSKAFVNDLFVCSVATFVSIVRSSVISIKFVELK